MTSPLPTPPPDSARAGMVTFTSQHLACAWFDTAALPDGRTAFAGGAWCQGVGSLDIPWTARPDRTVCLEAFKDLVVAFLTQPGPELGRVQRLAQTGLLRKLAGPLLFDHI